MFGFFSTTPRTKFSSPKSAQSSPDWSQVIFRLSLTKVTDFWFSKAFDHNSQSNLAAKPPNRKWTHLSATHWCIYTKLGGLNQDPIQRESRKNYPILPHRGTIIRENTFFIITLHIFGLKAWWSFEGHAFFDPCCHFQFCNRIEQQSCQTGSGLIVWSADIKLALDKNDMQFLSFHNFGNYTLLGSSAPSSLLAAIFVLKRVIMTCLFWTVGRVNEKAALAVS